LDNKANIKVNKDYYDSLYSDYFDVGQAKKLEKDIELVFAKSQRKMLSMAGFYSDDFKLKLKGKKVLEIGAGNGLNACFMAHFGASVTTQDISIESEKCITELSNYLNLNITAYSGDLRELQLKPKSFDLIVGKSILHHLTHELEDEYFKEIARLLKEDGEIRFVEPAHNRPFLRTLALLISTKERPSILNWKKYAAYKKNDPHPNRNNSSNHFSKAGKKYFKFIEIQPIGAEKQLARLFSAIIGEKLITNLISYLPKWLSFKLAKAQIITFKFPLK
jgi:2-polyprenyl-3-methyl-5-hydroxy-6-metoxy-1,4-benzoquinol methylase